MDLDITKWYVRFFFWSLSVWIKFWDNYDNADHYKRAGTNLCHAIRVTFVWMPLVLMLHVALVLSAAFVLIFLPLHYFEWTLYLPAIKVAGLIGIGILIIIIAVALFAMLINVIGEREARSPKKEEEPRDPSIWKIMRTWLADKEKGLCRLIAFHNPSEVEENA